MCIPHGAVGKKSNGFIDDGKVRKSIKMVSKREFEKGDPNFKDERVVPYTPKEKVFSFLDFFFK